MEPTDNLFDKVADFLNNELSPADEAAFRRRLEQDKLLRNEVALQRLMNRGIDAAATKRRLKMAQQHTVRQRLGRRTTRIVTSFALIVSLFIGGYYTYESLRQPTMQELAAQFGSPETPIRSDAVSPAGLDAVLTDYYAGQYASALTEVNRIPNDSLRLVPYYRGLVLLELSRYEEALRQLAQAQQSPDESVRQRADWYISVAYLRAGDASQTRRALAPIAANRSHAYHQFAVDLLNKLP